MDIYIDLIVILSSLLTLDGKRICYLIMEERFHIRVYKRRLVSTIKMICTVNMFVFRFLIHLYAVLLALEKEKWLLLSLKICSVY